MEKTEDKFWMDNLFDYAKSIIRHAPDFHNFAMAIMDYDTDAAPPDMQDLSRVLRFGRHPVGGEGEDGMHQRES